MIFIQDSFVLTGPKKIFIDPLLDNEFPLTHARIGYNTITRSPVTVSTEAVGFEGANLENGLTYGHWMPTTLPATARWDAIVPTACNYVGIAAHTLGEFDNLVEVQHSSDNSVWTTAISGIVQSNAPTLFLFRTVTARYWRIQISGGTGIPAIGVIYIGKVLEMQRPIFQGHSPITMSRETTIKPNRSEGGQFLGRSIIRTGVSSQYQFQNLTDDWVRSNFDPFIISARKYPFFIAWRPETYPEVAYGWENGDIVPTNSGPRNLMSVSFNVQGLGGYE